MVQMSKKELDRSGVIRMRRRNTGGMGQKNWYPNSVTSRLAATRKFFWWDMMYSTLAGATCTRRNIDEHSGDRWSGLYRQHHR